jgi:hypothetical protein
MRTIASLLFGRDAEGLIDLIAGEGGGEREAADRARRSGEWCGSTPGRQSADRSTAWPRGDGRGINIRNGRI